MESTQDFNKLPIDMQVALRAIADGLKVYYDDQMASVNIEKAEGDSKPLYIYTDRYDHSSDQAILLRIDIDADGTLYILEGVPYVAMALNDSEALMTRDEVITYLAMLAEEWQVAPQVMEADGLPLYGTIMDDDLDLATAYGRVLGFLTAITEFSSICSALRVIRGLDQE